MAKNKRPKFLDKETADLLAMLKDILSGDEIDIPKATKIIDELISRQPGDDPELSVDEALRAAADTMTTALQKVKDSYDAEVSMMEESAEEEEEEEEEEAPKKSRNKRGSKKSKKEEEPEEEDSEEEDSDEEEEDDEDDEEEDYSEMSIKDLKKECRTRGIKVVKGMGKNEMVKALEADDQE